ncbi:MAG: OmpH family outer membrane protein [Rhodanobacter sp.]
MNLYRPLLVASMVAAASLAITPVAPARAAVAQSATNTLGGNPVPGVCMLSREAIFAHAKVGLAASQHLKQLADQAKAQLDVQRKPLETEMQDFQKKTSSLPEAQRHEQAQALQKQLEAFRTQANELNERVRLTRSKVMERIGQDAESIVASAYKSHQCGLLLNRDSVMGGNTQNDLTSEVIQGLDGKVTTISFSLEPLPTKTAK